MNRVFVKSVRCFHDKQAFSVRPITILVGENSTGKTTLLATTRLAWDLCHGENPIDFNEDPFVLGAFDQIASFKGGRGGRAKEFTIGIEANVSNQRRSKDPDNIEAVMTITGRFNKIAGQPNLRAWQFNCGNYSAEISEEDDDDLPVISIDTPSSKYRIHELVFLRTGIPYRQLFSYLQFVFRDLGQREVAGFEGDDNSRRKVHC